MDKTQKPSQFDWHTYQELYKLCNEGGVNNLENHIIKHPKECLLVLKAQKAFLTCDEPTFERLVAVAKTEASLERHAYAWRAIRQKESELWRQVEVACEQLQKQSLRLEQLLAGVLLWLEEQRWQSGFEEGFVESKLSLVYSNFVTLYLPKVVTDKTVINEGELLGLFYSGDLATLLQGANNLNELQLRAAVAPLFEAISAWREYYDGIVLLYCFDETSYLIQQDGNVYLTQDQADYTRWAYDGCRYQALKNAYHSFVNESGEAQNPIHLSQIATGVLLEDSCFNRDTIDFYQSLQAWCSRRKETHTNALKGLFDQGIPSCSLAWLTLAHQAHQAEGIDVFPYEIHSKGSFNELMQYALDSDKDYCDWLKKLSFEVKASFQFDRFKPMAYDVYTKPFIRLGGDTYFCPMIFLSDADWFWRSLTIEMDLLNRERKNKKVFQTMAVDRQKEHSQAMEQCLYNRLREFLPETATLKLLGENESFKVDGNYHGDVDIFVADEETTLLIQLKASSPRLDLEQAFNERIQSERKAYAQLNKAEKYLATTPENNIWEMNPNTRCVKWLVSTSLEGVNRAVSKCNKVSYFDLLTLLELLTYQGKQKCVSIAELVRLLEEDTILQNFYGDTLPIRSPFLYLL